MRNFRTDPALRPQPERDPRDDWPTPASLRMILTQHVEPLLPPGLIWECACGEQELLANALRAVGREVIATDLYRDGIDFLIAPVPERATAIITNSSFKLLDEFIKRGFQHLDAGLIEALVLLWRWDHYQSVARTRVPARNRAAWVHQLCERTRWVGDYGPQPRWTFSWVTWLAGDRGPPRYLSFEPPPRQLILPFPESVHVPPP
jgi:hypothetical protein